MKITLHLGISVDGFIAKPNGDSDWVAPADEVLFKNRAKEAGCLVVGKRTFEQYQGTIYTVDGVINIILTSKPDPKITNVLSATSPIAAVELAKEKGCADVLIAGGTRTSTAFLEANLIDEILFSVHPLILGQGMKPFEGGIFEKSVKLLDSRNLEDGLVELHYEVLK
ncbi:MAG: dihydrofolate reductase [Candidatus Sungbacteria bacterium]|uniref:Dihydrofolate reductase n=1 Tax=Candidatus Sungiibacteriota bacterium TaxID=2750080 RepID=A0A931SCN6_9BACT|nr:dihydrofolate reductase [Candidatus Sungbacteria bacterium]